MQESLQGIRTVKAFHAPNRRCGERIDQHISAVENNANKMAAVVEPFESADGNARRRASRSLAD